MASLQPPATMENLPSDVLSNIFIRLFAKQLAQMRCVSKPWNALLSSSTFVKSHLDRSVLNNDAILIFFYEAFDDFTEPFSAHSTRSPALELTNFIQLPVNLRSEGATVCGSVNGLVCLYYGSHDRYVVRIWNPSLSAVLTLPPYSSPSRVRDPIKIHFRFGFDPQNDDYKVIKLASLLRPPNIIDPILAGLLGTSYLLVKKWLQVEVYSMRKGCWKPITQRFPSKITGISRQDGVCVDGRDGLIHWLCFIDDNRELHTIIAFDLGAETFREIKLPDSLLDHTVSYRSNVLGVLGGKLCVMSRVRDGKCEVWVMEEYGVSESWVKHHSLSKFKGNINPYGFTLQNEFLFETGNDYVALYDPFTSEVKIFRTMGRTLSVDKVVGYVDSLVWVAPSACDISSCSISGLQI